MSKLVHVPSRELTNLGRNSSSVFNVFRPDGGDSTIVIMKPLSVVTQSDSGIIIVSYNGVHSLLYSRLGTGMSSLVPHRLLASPHTGS